MRVHAAQPFGDRALFQESFEQRDHGIEADELLPVLGGRRLAAFPAHHRGAVDAEGAREVGVVGEGDFGDVVALLDERFVGAHAPRSP